MVLEPRGSILFLPHEAAAATADAAADTATAAREREAQYAAAVPLPPEHDEPETPIHPALEYEILQWDEHNSAAETSCREEWQQQQRRGRADYNFDNPSSSSQKEPGGGDWNVSMVMGLVCLVVFGSANTVALKLQAIHMYVVL